MDNQNKSSTDGKKRYKKTYARVSIFEMYRIKQYCLRNHLSKNRFMIKAAMYCAENNISVEELFSQV